VHCHQARAAETIQKQAATLIPTMTDALTVGEEAAGDCTADCEGEGDTAKDEVTGCGCESLGVHHLLEELMGLDICFGTTYTGPRHKG
jgi:hypothetical protein